MPGLRLPLTVEQYHQLPRHAAYRYEYLDGQALLTPRPRHYHAVLNLAAAAGLAAEEPTRAWPIRPVERDEVPRLAPLFAAAFSAAQPFAGLDQAVRETAATQVLDRTLHGGDGPWVAPASFVGLDPDGGPDGYAGALLVTLLPGGDPTDSDSYYWRDAAPPDLLEQRGGWPHLTWIFVSPLEAGRGLGTAMLAAAARALLALGYSELASTFLAGNDFSMFWHWRNGFRLLPYVGSYRLIRQRWLKREHA